MEEGAVERAAELLLAARREGRPLEGLPQDLTPASVGEAYRVQDRHVALLCRAYDAAPIGYKIGCTNPTAQALLGVDGPFYGQLLDCFAHCSPAVLDPSLSFKRVMEAEFAVRMAGDLPAATAPYTMAQVSDAIAALMPALEVVDSRFRDWQSVGAPALVADNGSAGRWVHGAEVADWRDLDLAGHAVRLFVNGHESRTGVGANVMGHPLAALTWLANALPAQGRGLRAGDIVSTGTAIEVYAAEPGDTVIADFGVLGEVSVSFPGSA